MSDAELDGDELAAAFEDALERLRAQIEAACASQPERPVAVALAVRAAFDFAVEDGEAARLLTTGAFASDGAGRARFQRLISCFAALLRDVRATAAGGTAVAADATVAGIALLVGQRLAAGDEDGLAAAAADAVQFVLVPMVGVDRARQIAAEHC